jgi:hypothetical protein
MAPRRRVRVNPHEEEASTGGIIIKGTIEMTTGIMRD